MVERYFRQGALSRLHTLADAQDALGEAGVGLSERTPRTQIAVRGLAEDRFFVDGFSAATGLALPVEANTAESLLGRTVFWLGPSEWLLTSAEEAPASLLEPLRQSLDGRHHALTDVSESRVAIRVEGPRLADLMSKVTSLDLAGMAPGACAQSTFARSHMLLYVLPDACEIYIHRSFAEYAWLWLTDAAQEYGVVTLR